MDVGAYWSSCCSSVASLHRAWAVPTSLRTRHSRPRLRRQRRVPPRPPPRRRRPRPTAFLLRHSPSPTVTARTSALRARLRPRCSRATPSTWIRTTMAWRARTTPTVRTTAHRTPMCPLRGRRRTRTAAVAAPDRARATPGTGASRVSAMETTTGTAASDDDLPAANGVCPHLPLPPRIGRSARRGVGGKGGAAIAERRRRRPCGRRHDVDTSPAEGDAETYDDFPKGRWVVSALRGASSSIVAPSRFQDSPRGRSKLWTNSPSLSSVQPLLRTPWISGAGTSRFLSDLDAWRRTPTTSGWARPLASGSTPRWPPYLCVRLGRLAGWSPRSTGDSCRRPCLTRQCPRGRRGGSDVTEPLPT